MEDIKTFDGLHSCPDNMMSKQREDVAKMRTSLLCCQNELGDTVQAMKDITVLRVYHQIARIIKYLEMMDKIEERLYASIDVNLATMDLTEPQALSALLTIQERMQKNMIESHKILEPYLKLQQFTMYDVAALNQATDVDSGILPKASRDKIRVSAKNVLKVLEEGNE